MLLRTSVIIFLTASFIVQSNTLAMEIEPFITNLSGIFCNEDEREKPENESEESDSVVPTEDYLLNLFKTDFPDLLPDAVPRDNNIFEEYGHENKLYQFGYYCGAIDNYKKGYYSPTSTFT